MSNNEVKNLNWSQRFALIEAYQPTEQQVIRTFGVSADDYQAAKECLNEGQLSVDMNFDVQAVGNLFSAPTEPSAPKPVTATKPEKTPKKRGRKGTKVVEAFNAIPSTPTPAEDFAKQYNVSLAVLRQSKRFDPAPELGDVRVKKIAVDGAMDKVLMVWREQA